MTPLPAISRLASSAARAAVIGALAATGVACVPRAPQAAQQRPQPPATTLHVAALQGNLEAVQQHIQAGSDLNARDSYGSTPLTVAITFGQHDAADALIEAGADLSKTDKNDSSPLHIAAFFGRTELVQSLLDHGANPRARNGSGSSPYDIAGTPFEGDRPVYDEISAGLAPLGLSLDYGRIAKNRLRIAAMLRAKPSELARASYAPAVREDWPVSTAAAQGLDPALLAELFVDAAAVEQLRGLVVVKNGHLIAEGYFGEGSISYQGALQSVTKSFTSALVGLALDRGCLESIEQPVLDFFPEFAGIVNDPRKREVTIKQLLQMRGGYPWEESDPKLWAELVAPRLMTPMVDFRLVNDPGSGFNYSNLSSHWLGVIVARACKTDLMSFAKKNLFSPLGVEPGEWYRDPEGNYVGLSGLHLTARDLARFGITYLNEGRFREQQVIPRDWVRASLESYSSDAWIAIPPQHHAGRYFRDLGYGYQWWSAKVGGREFDFAWGHGGQLVVLVDELDLVVVATSNPWHLQHDDEAWRHERATLNLVGKFLSLLPRE